LNICICVVLNSEGKQSVFILACPLHPDTCATKHADINALAYFYLQVTQQLGLLNKALYGCTVLHLSKLGHLVKDAQVEALNIYIWKTLQISCRAVHFWIIVPDFPSNLRQDENKMTLAAPVCASKELLTRGLGHVAE